MTLPTRPALALTRFESPLPIAWETEQIASFTSSEQARLARIKLARRRQQFIVGHLMLRWLLKSGGHADPRVEVDNDGKPRLPAGAAIHVSIAHSADAVAAIVAASPVGVDLEPMRSMRDPRAAAALLGMTAAESNRSLVLQAWVATEAQLKGGPAGSGEVWLSEWSGYHLAVAGVSAPLTGVLHVLTGTYNAAELEWRAFHGGSVVRT